MNDVRALFAEAEEDTGVVVSWEGTIVPAIDAGRAIIHRDVHGDPVGFLLWVEVIDPDTRDCMWIERMLWVRPSHRGGIYACRILDRWVRRAECAMQPITLVAGASLENPDVAKRLYQRRGFQVTYGFKRRIDHNV